MVQADRPRSPHGSYQLVRHHVLLAGWPARVTRDRRIDHDAGGAGVCAGSQGSARACRTRESPGSVLAFCRRSVGGCFQCRVHHRKMMETRDPAIAEARHGESSGAIHLPAPTAWPFLLALGIVLIAAALVTNIAIGA